MTRRGSAEPTRTVLEQKIRERSQTLEEFVDFVESVRRPDDGTLSLRHLKRLVSGYRGDGRPLGPVRPATARLLEKIFGLSMAELLAPPARADQEMAAELRERLRASRQVDVAVIVLLREQLDAIRRVDRQLGAVVAYDEVTTKAAQVSKLQSYSLSPSIRESLAALLAELSALAGWEALDQHVMGDAWDHHERAKLAAREAGSASLLAHSLAQQAVVLAELGETEAAVEQLADARHLARRSSPQLLRSWLAAAHGEGLAAAGRRGEALRAFDAAGALLPADPVDPELPFLFLGGSHLDRWRGHVLARLGDREAVPVLADALLRLDSSFKRAETGLRVDLATALTAVGESDAAQAHARTAFRLASEIGSVRQARRVTALQGVLGPLDAA